MASSGEDRLYPPQKYKTQSHTQATYALAKTPAIVDVVRCRKPGGFCRGQRLIAGLLRTDWLDLLFTYQSLTTFHAHSRNRTSPGPSVIPCVAKNSQLSGPLSGGRAMFFFDGSRIPFIRIADCLYRLTVGVALGILLVLSEHRTLKVTLFVCIALLSAALVAYTAGKANGTPCHSLGLECTSVCHSTLRRTCNMHPCP